MILFPWRFVVEPLRQSFYLFTQPLSTLPFLHCHQTKFVNKDQLLNSNNYYIISKKFWLFLNALFLLACVAETPHLYMDRIHCAHVPHVTRSPKGVPCVAINISYESTLGTDEVVMAVCVCIKPRFLPEGSYARDEPFLLEEPKLHATFTGFLNGAAEHRGLR